MPASPLPADRAADRLRPRARERSGPAALPAGIPGMFPATAGVPAAGAGVNRAWSGRAGHLAGDQDHAYPDLPGPAAAPAGDPAGAGLPGWGADGTGGPACLDDAPGWPPEGGTTVLDRLHSPDPSGARLAGAGPADALRQAMLVPGARAVAGIGLLGLLAVLVLAGRWWFTERAAEPVSIGSTTAAAEPGVQVSIATSPAQSGTIPPGSPGAPPVTGGKVLVHVAGKVRKPGVVTLAAGSRVADAIRAAGGVAPGADGSSVNMARGVVDGEQIVVAAAGAAGVSAAGGAGTAGTAQAPGSSPAAGGKVNLNTASQSQLESLPGVGPVLAGRIVAWRTEHGRFSRVEELGEVGGVGAKKLAALIPMVTV